MSNIVTRYLRAANTLLSKSLSGLAETVMPGPVEVDTESGEFMAWRNARQVATIMNGITGASFPGQRWTMEPIEAGHYGVHMIETDGRRVSNSEVPATKFYALWGTLVDENLSEGKLRVAPTMLLRTGDVVGSDMRHPVILGITGNSDTERDIKALRKNRRDIRDFLNRAMLTQQQLREPCLSPGIA